MNSSESKLDHVIRSYSHLNLTRDVVKKDSDRDPVGGGGCSDVFRAQLPPNWKASQRQASLIEDLLAETRDCFPESQLDGVAVAVKRLRIWARDKSESSIVIEKVIDEMKKWGA